MNYFIIDEMKIQFSSYNWELPALVEGDTTLLSIKLSNKIKGYKIDMKAFQVLANLGSRPDENNVTQNKKCECLEILQ